MSSSKFAGQLKQNNLQINNLKAGTAQTEKHMVDHEERLTETVNDFMEYQNFELKTHTENFDNPHQVTKNQVGLSNVTNDKQATKLEFDLHVKDTSLHVSSAEREAWNSKETTSGAQVKADKALSDAKSYVDIHTADKANPHAVTAAQVGLGNLTNDKQATKSEFDIHIGNSTVHISSSERNKWNGAQLVKLTTDSGYGTNLGSGVDTRTLTKTGIYYGKEFVNTPSEASFHTIVVIAMSDTVIVQEATRWFDNKKFIQTMNGANTWSGWKEIITKDQLAPTWKNLTLQNGWTVYSDRTPQYAIIGNRVVFRGAIQGGTIGTSANNYIPAFTMPTGSRSLSNIVFATGLMNEAGVAKAYSQTSGYVSILYSGENTSNGIVNLENIHYYI